MLRFERNDDFFCDLILKNHPSDDGEERKSKGTRARKD